MEGASLPERVVAYLSLIMKVLIVADSPEFESATVLALAPLHDVVVVTDGAAMKLPDGVLPHIICGDLDSINHEEAARLFPSAEILRLEDQNCNDFEKALLLARERGATEITAVCALGGRVDIALANVAAMVRHHASVSIEMIQGKVAVRALSALNPEGTTFECSVPLGRDLSCIAFERDAVVTLVGVSWPLTREVLRSGSHGVSNKGTATSVSITVHAGLVLFSRELEG